MKPCGLYIRPEFMSLGLSANALLILAEIDQLCKKFGSCRAHNKHLEKRFGLSNKTVSDTLKKLSDKGLIRRQNGEWEVTFDGVETTSGDVETTPKTPQVESVVSTRKSVKTTPNGVETTRPSRSSKNKNKSISPESGDAPTAQQLGFWFQCLKDAYPKKFQNGNAFNTFKSLKPNKMLARVIERYILGQCDLCESEGGWREALESGNERYMDTLQKFLASRAWEPTAACIEQTLLVEDAVLAGAETNPPPNVVTDLFPAEVSA
jgi:hypothetical protein